MPSAISTLVYEVSMVFIFEKFRSVWIFVAPVSIIVTFPLIAFFIGSSFWTHFNVWDFLKREVSVMLVF